MYSASDGVAETIIILGWTRLLARKSHFGTGVTIHAEDLAVVRLEGVLGTQFVRLHSSEEFGIGISERLELPVKDAAQMKQVGAVFAIANSVRLEVLLWAPQ